MLCLLYHHSTIREKENITMFFIRAMSPFFPIRQYIKSTYLFPAQGHCFIIGVPSALDKRGRVFLAFTVFLQSISRKYVNVFLWHVVKLWVALAVSVPVERVFACVLMQVSRVQV